LASFALALVGSTAGFLLGRWSASPVEAKQESDDKSTPTAMLLDAVLDLRRSMEERFPLVHEQSLATASSVSSREPAARDSHALDDLKQAVDRLTAALQDESHRARRTGDSLRSMLPESAGFPSLAAIGERRAAVRRPDGENSDWEERFDEDLRRAHLLWTAVDVVARYGVPSNVYASDAGINLAYERVRSADETCTVSFQVRQGIVTYVGFGCE
jgi:hypothetical protein